MRRTDGQDRGRGSRQTLLLVHGSMLERLARARDLRMHASPLSAGGTRRKRARARSGAKAGARGWRWPAAGARDETKLVRVRMGGKEEARTAFCMIWGSMPLAIAASLRLGAGARNLRVQGRARHLRCASSERRE